MTKSDKIAYKLADFLYKILAGISKKINRSALELNFLKYKIDFGERDDDLYIISYPKSGTTLMQMILYQLTTDGNMDFDHFDDVSPWIRNEAFENHKPKDLKSPRIIKSHDNYSRFDHYAKGKFIYVYRNVLDVAISKYNQDKNYKNPDLELNDFLKAFFKPGKYNWFTFHRDWMNNKKKTAILYVRYEDILNDFDKTLEKIIKFCNINPEKVDYARVKERTGFQYMKKYEGKFGIRPKKEEKVYDEFIRKGKAGEGKEYFSKEQLKEFEDNLKKYFKPVSKKP